jgi:hypothetical protein
MVTAAAVDRRKRESGGIERRVKEINDYDDERGGGGRLEGWQLFQLRRP